MSRRLTPLLSILLLAACSSEPDATPTEDMQTTTPGADMSAADMSTPTEQDMPGPVVEEDMNTPAADMANTPEDMTSNMPDADMSTPPEDMGTPQPRSLCAPMEAPSGNVITVTPSQANDLPSIIASANTGDTILLEDGVYKSTLSGEGSRRLIFRTPGITLRSASGDPTKVIIDGEYNTNELVYVTTDDITVAEVTLTRARDHLVHATGDGATTTRNLQLHRVHFVDAGEQFVKINSTTQDGYADDGEITCSRFELTDAGRPEIERSPGGCYTGGVDAHAARGWRIAHNHFEGIYCAGEGLAEHAVHFWRSSRDTIVENNTIIDCARGIGFGLGGPVEKRTYPDDPYAGVGSIEHFDGVIRNNVIFADIDFYDTGIELQYARGARVYHNTVMSTEDAAGFYTSIDYRFETTLVELHNNIARRITSRNGGMANREGNLEGLALDLFVDPLNGDFHLVEGAAAIDAGVSLGMDSGLDLDGLPREDDKPDVGADEYGVP
mgnify:CR=1 FL=1